MAHHTQELREGYKNHTAFNPTVFLAQKPDIFHYSYHLTTDSSVYHFARFWFYDMIYKNVLDNREFRKTYYPVWIYNRESNLYMHTWISDAFKENLDTNHYRLTIMENL